jgi:endonuclease YncB( thermonuclease family)
MSFRSCGDLVMVSVYELSAAPWRLAVIILLGMAGVSWSACGSAGTATTDAPLFQCATPYHHDGDAIRCGTGGRSMRLYAIDAPEMPGSCRPGRQCTPGDPLAARDHLKALTAGRPVQCRQLDVDRYRRPIVQCFAGKTDLSVAMVHDGFAVERYGHLRTGDP